ncbi:MAG: hypothetical protein JJT76_06640 [Clostridiaceae bacterium]|nr:hypothetical protein [Clostridiaceae bacterium]
MQNKAAVIIVLSIMTVIGGMVLNFQEFLMGNPATVKNLTVTFAYIGILMLILTISIKSKNRRVMKYFSVFWMINLFLAILTGYIGATGALADWSLPFAILLLGQWYGINFFVGSFLNASIIMAFISLGMFITSVISLKHTK